MKEHEHSGINVIERRYREIYAAEYKQQQQRRRTDPNYTIDDLRGILKDAYKRQDAGWLGQGALYDAMQNAIVAAYEAVLAEWQEELNHLEETQNAEGARPNSSIL